MNRISVTASAAAAVGAALASAAPANAVDMPTRYFTADSHQECRVTGWLSGSVAPGTTVQAPFTANTWRYFAAAYCPVGAKTTSLSLTLSLTRDGKLVSRPNPDSTWAPLYNGPAGSAPTAQVVSVSNLRGWPGTGTYQACAEIKRWTTVIQSTCTPQVK